MGKFDEIASEAEAWAKEFGIDTDGTRSSVDGAYDAFRHAYGSAALTQDWGAGAASAASGWREFWGGASGATAKNMDVHNDAVGQSLAAGTTSRYEIAKKALDALRSGQLTVVNGLTPAEKAQLDSIKECFAKGTPILTPFGEVQIEDLKVGDRVLSFDPSVENGRGRLVAKEITNIFLNTTREFVRISWFLNEEKKTLVTTPGHHFLREDGYFGPISDQIENGLVRVVSISGEIVDCAVEHISFSEETCPSGEGALV